MTPRVELHIRLGIRSVSPSDQSRRRPREETLGPYRPIAPGAAARSDARPPGMRTVADSILTFGKTFFC